MSHQLILTPEFIDFIPSELVDGKLYISITHGTIVHKCACGCGNEVVTPLSPVDWRIIYDGESVSIEPSIGNWSFPCKSHYWINHNQVQWAPRWTRKEIDGGRLRDSIDRENYYNENKTSLETFDDQLYEVSSGISKSLCKRILYKLTHR